MRWIALVAATLAGCGGDPPPPVALEDFTARARAALCDWAVRCAHVPDRPTCERLLDPKQLDTRRAEDAVAAGRLTYDAAAAGACVAATRDAHCLAAPWTDAACDDMLAGRVEVGGACTSGYECAAGGDCLDTTCDAQCCAGTCGPGPTGEPPEDERAAIGEPCQQHADCALGAYCETDRVCTRMPTEVGQRCLFGCDRGDLYCDIDVLECRRYGAPGETCDPAGIDAVRCDPAWSYCDGTCQPRPGAGQPCDDTQVCIASTFCAEDARCAPRGNAGAACVDDRQCEVACDPDAGLCVEYATCTID